MEKYNRKNINNDIFNFIENLQRAKSKELNISNYYGKLNFANL